MEKAFLDAREELEDLRGILNDVASGWPTTAASAAAAQNSLTTVAAMSTRCLSSAVKNELSATLRRGGGGGGNDDEPSEALASGRVNLGPLDVDAAIDLLDAPPAHSAPTTTDAVAPSPRLADRDVIDSFLD